MAEIRELVLTFLERLSHHALPKNRKRETLDACISNLKRSNLRAAGLTEDLGARKMEAFQLNTEKSKQLDCKTVGFFSQNQ